METADTLPTICNASFTSDVPEFQTQKQPTLIPERGQWASRTEFFLSCVGLSVGLGNIWRFPFLAYQNGGGAFLIPYFIILFLVGKPLYLMELALGQYASLGPWTVFRRMCPLFGGLGVAMCVSGLICCIYYNVIMSYTIFYLVAALESIMFSIPLPWSHCDPQWADERCFVQSIDTNFLKVTNESFSIPVLEFVKQHLGNEKRLQPSPEQYFDRHVLQKDTAAMEYSLENPGPVIWQLCLCLLFCWMVVYLCLVKGIQSSGKVVYFTATFPYVVLMVLLVRGILLEGALGGIVFLFKPQWNSLLDIRVWRSAASQVFYSLSVSGGGLIMFGSYNKFHLKVYKDAMLVCALDTVTSIIASIVIFSVLGNLAWQLDVPIANVAKGGQGLAFVAYPEALSRLPLPQLWSILFFFMLFILGLDSQFGMMETLLTAVYDEFPQFRTRKAIITAVACVICFLLALPCLTHGGLYVIDLMDTYGGGFSVILIAFYEIVAVFWIYGMKRLTDNINLMMQYQPSVYFRCCWLIIAPLVLLFIFIYSVVDYKPFTTTGKYPIWGDAIGWIFALVSILQVPIWAVKVLCHQKGPFLDRLRTSTLPLNEWGHVDQKNRKLEDLMCTTSSTSTSV